MTNTVARSREQVAFCVAETTKGTAVFPSAASDLVLVAGDASINQQPSFTNSEEIVDSLDLLDRFQDQVGQGSWSLPIYIRPSGTKGTAPMAGILFESLQGAEPTIVASTSVTYSQAKTKPSFTLWVKKSHTVFFGSGACVESAKLTLSNKGAAKFDMSGGFMRMGWAGTDEADGAVSSSDAVPVLNAKKFTAGAYIQLGSDTNTGAGYKIASVNYTTNILTLAESVSCASGAVVKGYLPTYSATGVPLENKDMTISFDGDTKLLKSTDLTIGSPVAWQSDEITASGYIEEYVEDMRSISLSPNVLFRESDLDYFYNATANTKTNVIITVGDEAGKICTINLPYVELEVPQISTSSPTVSLSITGTGLGSVGEDSCTIVFT